MARFISFAMFEKWTKKFASKATDNAIEGAKQSLNDKIGEYLDIILPGLAIGVIVFGSRHITKRKPEERQQFYIPQNSGQPVIVNNYYHEREDRQNERNQRNYAYIRNGQVQCQKKAQNAKY